MIRFFFLSLCLFLFLKLSAQEKYPVKKIGEDLELIKLSDKTFIHVSYLDLPGYGRTPANGLVVINAVNEAFIIDSPWNDSLTQVLLTWIADSMKLNVTGFIPTHWHNDCMGGLATINKYTIPSYANQKTIDIARTKNLPLPTNSFSDSLCIESGNVQLMLFDFGPGHSLDNIILWLPQQRIIFAGCLIKDIRATNLGNTADGDVSYYPYTLARLRKRIPMADIVIPGHGSPGDYRLIEHTEKLAEEANEK